MSALILPVSGPYSASIQPPNVSGSSPYYNRGASSGPVGAQALGLMNDSGYEISMDLKSQEVNETDGYGMTLLDFVYRGQDWRVRMTGREWFGGLLLLLQPFGAVVTGGIKYGILAPQITPITAAQPGAIGSMASLASGILSLVSDLGSPPTAPATLTALQAILSPNSRATFDMTSKVRDLPLELCLLPYSVTVSSVALAVPFTVT